MRVTVLTFVLAVAEVISGFADDTVVIGPGKLTRSVAITWDGRNHETIGAQIINDPISIILLHCSDIEISGCDLRSVELNECERVRICNCWIHDSQLSDWRSIQGQRRHEQIGIWNYAK